jgi:hypothetical protein
MSSSSVAFGGFHVNLEPAAAVLNPNAEILQVVSNQLCPGEEKRMAARLNLEMG